MSEKTICLYDVFLQADKAVVDQETAKAALAALDAFDAEAMADVLTSMAAYEWAEQEEATRQMFMGAREAYVDWLLDF
jgi:hypothetical protein